ncbi:hypothetical protein [Brevibacillus laterosporus]|uniref:hypothetical protein n=1 Tax=Brevibacillus laterosporus TaxID=1465 RepID=UPI000CE3FBB0|nr:hypothetical protein [Brevibacillus laterosporus]MED1662959.1 hypothetical protein [Brevibacillus laterosporus]MED1668983.1 hypothetical protein [Brevibacillus laterosporus]MED1716564.1 hypothetical protein [Brevibacillus laterosporus]PPA86401.1 hypothetical protein C4A76_14265 [Brevibacillus laterosporus]
MNKKASKWMIGALALAVFAPTAAFAATNTNVETTKVEQTFQKRVHYSLEDRQANQQELMKIINKYNPDLADDFQKLFDQQEKMKESKRPQMDEETKTKLDEIREQVKDGTLTKEQAMEEMENLGLKGFEKGKVKIVKNLDEETKKKLDEIQEQVKAGTLTEEQAKDKMEELGIKQPVLKMIKLDEETKKQLDEIREQVKAGTLTEEQAKEEMGKLGIHQPVHKNIKFKIDEETKKKLDEIQEQVKAGTLTKEQAQEEMEKLGIKHSIHEDIKLDEETKKKLDEIQEQVKAGTLTKEQAKEEMEKLGIKHFVSEGKENIMEQIKAAADADDADTVNKLLQEWLEKMQNKKNPKAEAESEEEAE